jgi:sugar lactone lactonase YvrE
MKILKWVVISLAIFVGLSLLWLKISYGSGAPFPEIQTAPIVADENYEAVIRTEFPPGMVAADPNSDRLFFSYHMLHQPERAGVPTVYEWVDGESVPFPSADPDIQRRFDGAMGINVDRQGRLWIVRPGGMRQTISDLIAIDIDTREVVYEHTFAPQDAQYSQDFRITADGGTLFFADTGLSMFIPAYIGVFDVASRQFRKVLVDHPSVAPQDWKMITASGKPHDLGNGLLDFRVGVDGIALSADDEWLYYAAMTNDSAYRIRTEYLLDESLSDEALAGKVDFLGKKPSSDAIELDAEGNLVITNCMLGGLSRITPEGRHETLVLNPEVSWPDSVTVARDGSIYYTDSHLASLLGPFLEPASLETLRESGPYWIYRVRP